MRTSLTLVALAGLLAPLAAQGTYQPYGNGCVSSSCGSSNSQATTPSGSTQNTNIFALRVEPSASTRVVFGFELLTRSDPAPSLIIDTQIYGADPAGAPTGAPLATGRMTILNVDGWYKTTLTTPLVVPAGQVIFLSYTSTTGMKFPFIARGTGETASHFWHPASATTWNGTPPLGFQTQPWAWRLDCGGGGVGLDLSATGTPTLNTSMTVDLRDARPNAPAIFALGISNSTWNGLNLPFDLSILGANGCNIYASAEYQFFIQTTKVGTYQFRLNIPNDPTLVGFEFYNQYVVDDPSANGFGVTFSNGGKATIG